MAEEAGEEPRPDKGKAMMETPLISLPRREINLGERSASLLPRPSFEEDKALARQIAAEEGSSMPPPFLNDFEGSTSAPPSQPEPEAPIAAEEAEAPDLQTPPPPQQPSTQQAAQPSAPESATPVPSPAQSELGIADVFTMFGRELESKISERMNSFQNDYARLSASFQQVQEQQRVEKMRQSSSNADSSAAALQAIREEIRKGAKAVDCSQTMQNLRSERSFLQLIKENMEEREEFKKAMMTFGKFAQQREDDLKKEVAEIKRQVQAVSAERASTKYTMEQLISAVRELLELAKNWLPEEEVQKIKEKVKQLDP